MLKGQWPQKKQWKNYTHRLFILLCRIPYYLMASIMIKLWPISYLKHLLVLLIFLDLFLEVLFGSLRQVSMIWQQTSKLYRANLSVSFMTLAVCTSVPFRESRGYTSEMFVHNLDQSLDVAAPSSSLKNCSFNTLLPSVEAQINMAT